MENPYELQAVKYTTVLENGIIKIPQFEKYKRQEVEIFIVLKPQNIEKKEEFSIEEFLDKWFGYFPEIETDDVRYNAIIGNHK